MGWRLECCARENIRREGNDQREPEDVPVSPEEE
jgi:hypothetical protein